LKNALIGQCGGEVDVTFKPIPMKREAHKEDHVEHWMQVTKLNGENLNIGQLSEQ